jgi:hypothetical protein
MTRQEIILNALCEQALGKSSEIVFTEHKNKALFRTRDKFPISPVNGEFFKFESDTFLFNNGEWNYVAIH